MYRSFTGANIPLANWPEIESFITSPERTTKVIESSAFSMAMVTRHSLGLRALKGSVVGLISDSISGAAAAATLRHLSSGGAKTKAFVISSTGNASLKTELDLCREAGVEVSSLIPKESDFTGCHSVIAGVFGGTNIESPYLTTLWESLNAMPLPVQSILPPIPDSNAKVPLIYAASTLFLGLPTDIPVHLKESLGRTYLCDISLPRIYSGSFGEETSGLFSEQPVVQIYPTENS